MAFSLTPIQAAVLGPTRLPSMGCFELAGRVSKGESTRPGQQAAARDASIGGCRTPT